jgi:cyclopropane-fatty-acyl-phospholipid synthase
MSSLLASTLSPGNAAAAKPAVPARTSFFERAVLRAFEGMSRGRLRMELSDGRIREFGTLETTTPTLPLQIPGHALIRVRSPAFFKKCALSGDIGFAEAYLDGDWESPDVTAVIAWFIHNVENAPTLSGSRRRTTLAVNLLRHAHRLAHALRHNSPANSRRNIREHYDLSNDFFALFLDESMTYSSALWTLPSLTLSEAQHEKNDELCQRLRLKPADHVLEIGTGWGGWSLHAASHYGCRVTTITISQEQFEYARRRVAQAGLSERIEVRLQDYREIGGTFDKIVSIEMLEAVGHAYQQEYFKICSRLLKPGGLLALQFITCPDARYDEFRRGVDFIQKHIFPGSLLLSLNRVNQLLSGAGGFVLHHCRDFGPDYARTLRHWRETFVRRLDDARALGFDERFIRKWSYYLSYCEAAFALRNISVVHTVHTRPNNLEL